MIDPRSGRDLETFCGDQDWMWGKNGSCKVVGTKDIKIVVLIEWILIVGLMYLSRLLPYRFSRGCESRELGVVANALLPH